MTPTELKALHLLKDKGLVDIHHKPNSIPGVPPHLQNTGYYAQITSTGEKVLIEEQPVRTHE